MQLTLPKAVVFAKSLSFPNLLGYCSCTHSFCSCTCGLLFAEYQTCWPQTYLEHSPKLLRGSCAADVFAVQVSIDGTSFTTDGTRFQYYRTPELTHITPGLCRPPFPRLRIDGKNIRPNDRLLVRFEEEVEKEQRHSEGSPLAGDDNEQASLPPPQPGRTFDIPGRAESEIVQAGTDPETGLPIHEERWFIVCDSPALPPGGGLPFISRVTVAPNGATFRGKPLRFVAHDPWADACFPMALPIPVVDGENPDGSGTFVRITGRNLYRGDGLAARLRFGRDKASVVPLDAVAFARGSETITGAVPVVAGALVGGEVGTAAKAAACPPAISTTVEVSMDGKKYFAVPEKVILYHDPVLTLKGDGFFPIADGGVAELVPAGATFRGNEAKARPREIVWVCETPSRNLHVCQLVNRFSPGEGNSFEECG